MEKSSFYLSENEARLIKEAATERWLRAKNWRDMKKRSCMLCVAFLYSGEESLCEECPVTRYTGETMCLKTPLNKEKPKGEQSFASIRCGMIELANEMLDAGGFSEYKLNYSEAADENRA